MQAKRQVHSSLRPDSQVRARQLEAMLQIEGPEGCFDHGPELSRLPALHGKQVVRRSQSREAALKAIARLSWYPRIAK
jgi:hypothetical protein